MATTPHTQLSITVGTVYNVTTSAGNERELIAWPVWSAIFLTVITLIGTVGNIFIIGAVAISTRLRTKGNAFVVNLAVADLLVCAYVMPMGIATSQDEIMKFGGILCDINAFITLTTCGVSTQTLMLISIERYFHICKLHWHDRIFTPITTGVYIFVIWIYTMIWTVQGWTGWTHYIDGGSAHICLASAAASLSYTLCLAFFGMILPMIIIAVCYTKIFIAVIKSKKNMNAHQTPQKSTKKTSKENKKLHKEQQLVVTLFTIVIIFIACWLPVSLVLIITSFAKVPRELFIFVIWLSMCNSIVNSFVYGILNKNFRNGYKRFFRYIFCCCGNTCADDHCQCTHVSMSSDDNQSERSIGKQSTGGQTYLSRLSSKSDVRGSLNTLNEEGQGNNVVNIYVSDSNNNINSSCEAFFKPQANVIGKDDGLVEL